MFAASLASTGKYKVKGLVRNLEKAKEALSSSGGGDDLEIELAQGDILDESSLGGVMKVSCPYRRSRFHLTIVGAYAWQECLCFRR